MFFFVLSHLPKNEQWNELDNTFNVEWNLVIVNSGLSPILFTKESFLLLPVDSMIFSFITYNWYRMLYLITVHVPS